MAKHLGIEKVVKKKIKGRLTPKKLSEQKLNLLKKLVALSKIEIAKAGWENKDEEIIILPKVAQKYKLTKQQLKEMKINEIVRALLNKSYTVKQLCKTFKIKESTLKDYQTIINKPPITWLFCGFPQGYKYKVSIVKGNVSLKTLLIDQKRIKNNIEELHKNKYYIDGGYKKGLNLFEHIQTTVFVKKDGKYIEENIKTKKDDK